MQGTPLRNQEIADIVKLNLSTSYYRRDYHFTGGYEKGEDGSLISTGSWSSDKYITDQQKDWNRVLFTPLLQADPTIQPLIDQFWEEAKCNKYIESVAGRVFDGKISLEPIIHLIFNHGYNNVSKGERKDFIKRIVNLNSDFMDHLHSKLKQGKDYILLEAYIELLPKHFKSIKDTPTSVLNLLGDSSILSESNQVKVLNVIVKTLGPTEENYNFIQINFSNRFEKLHTLRAKYNELEKKFFSKFKKDKNKDLLTNFGEYTHVINISDSILVDQFGINKNNIQLTKTQIFNSIKHVMKKKVGTQLEFFTNTRGFHIASPNISDQEPIEDLMSKIREVLPNVVLFLNKEQNNLPSPDESIKRLESALMYFELNDKLPQKETQPTRKNKI